MWVLQFVHTSACIWCLATRQKWIIPQTQTSPHKQHVLLKTLNTKMLQRGQVQAIILCTHIQIDNYHCGLKSFKTNDNIEICSNICERLLVHPTFSCYIQTLTFTHKALHVKVPVLHFKDLSRASLATRVAGDGYSGVSP